MSSRIATSGSIRAADIASIQPRQELHAVLWIAQRTTLRRHGRTPAHVAERPQPLGRLGIDGRGRRGSGSTERSVERLPHLFDSRRLLDRTIAGFGRIALELVELRTRRVDELCSWPCARHAEAPTRAPIADRATRSTREHHPSGAPRLPGEAIDHRGRHAEAPRRSRAASATRRSSAPRYQRAALPEMPGPATINGTRTVASYTNTPCVPSPCSPRLSP